MTVTKHLVFIGVSPFLNTGLSIVLNEWRSHVAFGFPNSNACGSFQYRSVSDRVLSPPGISSGIVSGSVEIFCLPPKKLSPIGCTHECQCDL